MSDELCESDLNFLRRYLPRGWEENICHRAVRSGYLRRYRSEYHFTEAGRTALLGA